MKLFSKKCSFSINNKIFININKNKIIIKIIIISFLYTSLIKINFLYYFFIKYQIIKNIYSNNYYLYDHFKSYENDLDHFNLIDINYAYSFKYKIVKVEYLIGFYDKNNSIIVPSDLTLYNNLHIICYIENKKSNILNSLANIHRNCYYKYIEFYNINEKLKFGIKIFRTNESFANIEEKYDLIIIN